jgi:hypothetical protein
MRDTRSLVLLSILGLTSSACFLIPQAGDPNATNTNPTPSPGTPSGAGPSSGGGSTPQPALPSQPEPSQPPKPAKIDVVSVEVRNECSEKVEYCVDSGGSTLNTSLGGNTSTSSQMRPGTEIQLKKGSSCSTTLFTVPESADRQKVILCKK